MYITPPMLSTTLDIFSLWSYAVSPPRGTSHADVQWPTPACCRCGDRLLRLVVTGKHSQGASAPSYFNNSSKNRTPRDCQQQRRYHNVEEQQQREEEQLQQQEVLFLRRRLEHGACTRGASIERWRLRRCHARKR